MLRLHLDVGDTLTKGAEGIQRNRNTLSKRALAIAGKTLGPYHPQVAKTLSNLGEVYRRQARYAEAEPYLQGAIAVLQRTLGDHHPQMATSLNNLAAVY